MRQLQTTRAICQTAIDVFTPMELDMCLDGWIAQDALAAHELMDIIREIRDSGLIPETLSIAQRMEEWA